MSGNCLYTKEECTKSECTNSCIEEDSRVQKYYNGKVVSMVLYGTPKPRIRVKAISEKKK